MTTCPRCNTYPSRRVMTGRGRAPLCLPCMAEKWKAKYARRMGRVPAATALDDISAAEIDRRYTAALAVIRRRRHEPELAL